jgi:chorismate-pyruvate lyase
VQGPRPAEPKRRWDGVDAAGGRTHRTRGAGRADRTHERRKDANVDAKQSLLDLFAALNEGGPPLSIFQRILLVTDGTVTDVLEAYANEPIRVVKLNQSFDSVDAEKPELDLPPSGRLLRRTVLLQGALSGQNFLFAESAITPDGLAREIVDGLVGSDKPVGRLLAQHRVETFREIVALGFDLAGTCAQYFEVEPTSRLVFRTYRILVRQQPVMRITEKFPLSLFAD